MKLEFYAGTNPAGAMMAEAMLKKGAPIKLKFVAVRDPQTGEQKISVFTGDEHAGVLGDLLGIKNAELEGARSEVRSRLVSAGIIQNRDIVFGSESIERIFGIPENEQTVGVSAEAVRSEILHVMGA